MFGGTMISLILPKLIRSVIRDGIWTFSFGRQQRRADISYSTTQGKRAAFNGCLPKTNCSLLLFVIYEIFHPQNRGKGRRPAWQDRRPI
jgi:hypothetical protein